LLYIFHPGQSKLLCLGGYLTEGKKMDTGNIKQGPRQSPAIVGCGAKACYVPSDKWHLIHPTSHERGGVIVDGRHPKLEPITDWAAGLQGSHRIQQGDTAMGVGQMCDRKRKRR
jgi:hypothetical protein